jgi:hypothetical protein
MNTISIVNSFSEFPGLRHCNISDKSGEEFYHKVLNLEFFTAYEKKEKLVVNLDGTSGYAPSFLDEAFGNLVFDFSLKIVNEFLEIISTQEPHWKEMIEQKTCIQWEERRKNGQKPAVTAEHKAWYRLVNGQTISKVWETPSAV